MYRCRSALQLQLAPLCALVLPLLLCRLVAATSSAATLTPNLDTPPMSIWIDEFFFADGETALLREAVDASGGAAVVAGTTRNRVFQLKSYQRAATVDVMWTGQTGCYEAFKRRLNTSHAVSCVPGVQSITNKGGLVTSMEAGYGEAAWGIVPRSFRMPSQYANLAAHIKEEQRNGRSGLWVLKEDVHRGKGVGVVTAAEALAHALDYAPPRKDDKSGQGPRLRHVLVQSFLEDQYLVGGRPFYIRMWVVLFGADPARAYMFDGGVVVFGKQQGQAGQGAEDLIVNLWKQDRKAAAPWSLRQLMQHLEEAEGGEEEPRLLRQQLQAAVAASLAAALPGVRRVTRQLAGYQGGSFEVLGMDFLVDSSLRPWLVEANKLPSLARKVVGCAAGGASGGEKGDKASKGKSGKSGEGEAKRCEEDVPFDLEKEKFVHALLQMLTERHHRHAELAQQAQQLVQAGASEAAGGGEGAEGGKPRPASCGQARQVAQLLEMQAELATAQRLGFIPLTEKMYRGLACMAALPYGIIRSNKNTISSDSNNSTSDGWPCPLLADLPPPTPRQQQECRVGGWADRLKDRLRGWAAMLRLEAATLIPRLRHPAARRKPNTAPTTRPYKLRSSDERMLAWLKRGSPAFDSPQAIKDFCDKAADRAPVDQE